MVTLEAHTSLSADAVSLDKELDWLAGILQVRLDRHLGREATCASIYDLAPPPLAPGESTYAHFVQHYEMTVEERLAVLLVLAPHVRPEVLDVFFVANPQLGRGYTEFGGVKGKMHGGFLPTGETVLFVLSEGDLQRRIGCRRLFDRDHYFARHSILKLDPAPPGEPIYSGPVVLSNEMVDYLTTGAIRKPDFSTDFPARLLTTEMEWADLVLAPHTSEQLREMDAWIQHGAVLMNDWGMSRRLRPGYKGLFYGPPGTGKTLAATLLGKRIGRDVYRIDLSTVVSKYIGETEKNLESVFNRAENLDCILFFDEADALFGKRTNISDAHDRYANQGVSYLLQRIEDFPGLVILASNYKSNLDEAFMRRFQAVVHFPMPSAPERERLWADSFSEESVLDASVCLDAIARKYELSGGAIMNVVRYASLMALQARSNVIRHAVLLAGIRRELQKDGKTL